jgi:agmatinase
MDHIGRRISELKPGTVAVVGVPYDEQSSFLRGPALAPARIRHVLHSGETNWSAENGLDLGTDDRWRDLGDLELGSGPAAFAQIERAIALLLAHGTRVLSLGGDHAITYPILRAFAAVYPNLNVLHIDAHPDLYDEFEGNRLSHACPFARVMEEGLVARLLQVGIRAANPHQRDQIVRFGVKVIEMRNWPSGSGFSFDGPLYLSLDLDAIDPAFAPGVSHHEPGGLSVRDVIQIIQDLDAPLVGADIVELNPNRDLVDITAMTAVKFLKEIVACMLADRQAGGRGQAT